MSRKRHYFPGNNTPKGFFSYYEYILSQKEANRIYCIKGGPGVGKSSFMKSIADSLIMMGEDIDYLHCSSDPSSLDGIILKNRKIAFVDATSPHVVEPINPGAVDSIIHLGEFWNEEGIRHNKENVIKQNSICKKSFENAYNYLKAAESLYDNIESVYREATLKGQLYKIAAELINREFSHKEICLNPGKRKKYFASAITPDGIINYIESLLGNFETIYVLNTPVGARLDSILRIFSEGAVYRGFDVEEYYCSIKPVDKLEHLIVPSLGIAIITENKYHSINNKNEKMEIIDCKNIFDDNILDEKATFIALNRVYMDKMLYLGVSSLAAAKANHRILEEYYIPNMDFKKIDNLRSEILGNLSQK